MYDFVTSAVTWHDLIADPRDTLPPAPHSHRTATHSSAGRLGNRTRGGGRTQGKLPRTFSVESRVWDCSVLSSSQLASVRAKDAICDAMREACGGEKPPSPQELAALLQRPEQVGGCVVGRQAGRQVGGWVGRWAASELGM